MRIQSVARAWHSPAFFAAGEPRASDRPDEARAEADRLRERPRPDGHAETVVRILVHVGDTEEALREIEQRVAGPSETSAHVLRLDPRWGPIRNDPRCQALLKKYDPPQPVRC